MNQISFPNLLLIAGTGRNVGKTSLACRIIKQESEKHACFAIKISAHFHDLHETVSTHFASADFTISEEFSLSTSKDSSLMLQAGAKRVFYVQAKKEFTLQAFLKTMKLIPENVCIICESGGLSQAVLPGLLVVCTTGQPEKNLDFLQKADVVFNNFEFESTKIHFKHNRWMKSN